MIKRTIGAIQNHIQSDSPHGFLASISRGGKGSEGSLLDVVKRGLDVFERNNKDVRLKDVQLDVEREHISGSRRFDLYLTERSVVTDELEERLALVLEAKHVVPNTQISKSMEDLVRQLCSTDDHPALGLVFLTESGTDKNAVVHQLQDRTEAVHAKLLERGIGDVCSFDADVTERLEHSFLRALFVGIPEIQWKVKPGFFRIESPYVSGGDVDEIEGRIGSVCDVVRAHADSAVVYTDNPQSLIRAVLEEDKYSEIISLEESARVERFVRDDSDRLYSQLRAQGR